MAKNNKDEFTKLLENIRTSLNHWHGDRHTKSPLSELLLFRTEVGGGARNTRYATNQVLLQGIKVLEQEYPEDADFLQMRYLDDVSIQQIAHRTNLAEPTVFTRLKRARQRLKEIIYEHELKARQQQKFIQNERLPTPSYVQLIGLAKPQAQLMTQIHKTKAPWIIAIEGVGGIGKTTLANALMRQVVEEGIFDGIGWISAKQTMLNLGGIIEQVDDNALTTEELVSKLVQQLMPAYALSSELSSPQMKNMLKGHFERTPHLIVIDNLETLADVESLAPLLQEFSNPTKFILTTRERPLSKPNIYHFGVPELSMAHSLDLIRQEAEVSNLPELAASSDRTLQLIYDTVGGNPLAIRLVVGQVHIHSLDTIIESLHSNDLSRSDSRAASQLYTYIYRHVWDKLDDLSRDVLSTMPLINSEYGGDINFIAEISELSINDARMALNKLIVLNLVDARGSLQERRYSIHGLTRTFVNDEVVKW